MWVARDKLDNELNLYTIKPVRDTVIKPSEVWVYPDGDEYFDCDHITIDSKLFPELTWEDEPLEVELFPVNYKDYITKINSND